MPVRKNKSLEVGRAIASLRTRFVQHDRYRTLADEFDRLLYRRRANLETGIYDEARGIVVVGLSGSGKSTALLRLFEKHTDLQLLTDDVVRADVVSLNVPSPATLKHVGHSCLNALGYPLRRNQTAGIIWELVQNHLSQRQTLFLHLDEAQDFYSNRNRSEMQAVVNTLKSLMQNRNWPTGIILSGMPALKELLDLDPQLSRRMVPIHFAPISYVADGENVETVLRQYASLVSLAPNPDLYTAKFRRRLIHAAASEFGLVIELIIGAIEDALFAGSSSLSAISFANAYRRRSGCIDGLNPFLGEDYRAIDARKLLTSMDTETPIHLPDIGSVR